MSIDSAITIAWDVFKSVVAPIKRQFGYVIYSKRHAQDLQEKVVELADEVDRVRNLAEEARNNLRNVYGRVTEWHASAEKALTEARGLLRDVQEASKTCCYETLPDPKCRYQFSRKAKDKIEVIQRLTKKCSGFKELNDISFRNPAPGNVAALTPAKKEGKDVVQLATVTASPSFASTLNKVGDNGVFESRASIIRDITDALANDSNSVVGVYGMGGVGKSTLLADVERRIMEKKSFDWVTKADVSENPDIKKIQGEIAHALGLDIKKEDIVSVRAGLLHKRLENEEREKKKVLIILDNLWKGLDLKSVGIPSGHDNKVIGCKLLLTSRFQDVLRREMSCDRDFRLEELKEEEARRLFERKVGDKVHNDPFKSLVDEALCKCAGLPFLIITMAKLFKYANFYQWEDALKQIEMSTNKGISERINKMLQLTYDYFEGEEGKEVKLLLRLCVVCGVSKPSLENLVRYSVGLRLFGENSNIKEARNRLSSLIQTLQASSLLLDDEDAGGIKIHDLVRGFVASIASRDDPLLVWKYNDKSVMELSKDKLKSYTAVCFPYVDMKELPEEFDCPEMQIFLLFTNNEFLKVPDSYFNSMKKLMVLHLSQVCLSCSPSPFQFLENLHTLCLNGCSLEDVAMIGELKGLHILSFVNSKIQRLPKEIGQLVELRLLDLSYCFYLEIIEPGVLGSLMKLEELYMENSFDRWNAVEQTPPTNARLIELNNIKNLCTLHVSILDPSVLPEDLNVNKLTKYKICIGDKSYGRSYKGLSILELKLDPTSDILQKEYIQTLLGKTDDLFLDGSNGIEQSICMLSQEGFPKLKHLQVKNSPSIHCVLQSPSHIDFKILESLILNNLINLEKICNNHISSNSFNALKVVRVESCDKMQVLFPISLLRELPQLEEIRAIECHLMREIVEVDDCGKVELHNLHVLELRDLPNVENFFTMGMGPSSSTSIDQVGTQVAFFNGQQVAFPSLETLYINGMDNIEILWDNQVAAESFHKLKSLEVWRCNQLLNIVPSCILGWLRSLESLEVGSCDSLEVVFKVQPLNPLDGHTVAYLPLKKLTLDGLSELRCVWDKELYNQVKFQCLRLVTISKCESLTSLFPASVAIHLTQLEELGINECGIVELIEKEDGLVPRFVFPNLTSLDLEHLTELKCIYTGKHTSHWPALKTLRVRGCDKVEILALHLENEMPLDKQPLFLIEKAAFPSLDTLAINRMDNIEILWDNEVAAEFQKLERLVLNELPKLKCVWDKELHNLVKFQCLHSIDIYECKSLSSLFPVSIAIHLIQLEDLRIDECGIVELIEKEDGLVPRFVFPKLSSLALVCLAEMRCIYTRKHTSHWPALKTLRVMSCDKVEILASHLENEMPLDKQPLFLIEKVAFPRLETLDINGMDNIEILWDNEVAAESFQKLERLVLSELPKLKCVWDKELHSRVKFQCLRSIDVYECKSLSSLFPVSIAIHLTQLEELKIVNCGIVELIEKEDGLVPRFVFPKLTSLKLEHLTELKCIYTGKHTSYWPALKTLRVHGCDKVEILALHLENEMPLDKQPLFLIEKVAFPSLETLEINGMDNIEKLWDNEVVAESFQKLDRLVLSELPKLKCVWDKELHSRVKFQCLRSIDVYECKSLSSLFPVSIAIHLTQLEELKIINCGIVELIEKEDELVPRFVFPKLTSLKLEHLTELKCIYTGKHTSYWPTLKTLRVYGCDKVEILASRLENEMPLDKQPLFLIDKVAFPSLETLYIGNMDNIETIWDNQVDADSFHKLNLLGVWRCNKLLNIVPSCILGRLRSLESLWVRSCHSLEVVFKLQPPNPLDGHPVAYLPLKRLVLDGLPELKCVWDKELYSQVKFQCLRFLSISRCKSLTSLFPALVAIHLTQLEKLEISECGIVELIEKEDGQDLRFVFPKLTFLKLEHLIELKCIYIGKHASHWPALKTLEVLDCDKVEILASQPENEMPLDK